MLIIVASLAIHIWVFPQSTHYPIKSSKRYDIRMSKGESGGEVDDLVHETKVELL